MGCKALVTGATGFIGINLIKELLAKKWEVYVLLREDSNIKSICEITALHYLYEKDIIINHKNTFEIEIKFKNVPRFDVCFHLAAYGVDYKKQDIYKMIDGNIKYTLKVLEFCNVNGTGKFINTGSCFEYGANKGVKLKEDEILNPKSYYAIAKVAAENMATLYAKNNSMNLITVRPFSVFGEGEGFHRLIPELFTSAILGKPLKMTNGEQVRDYLYVKDLVNGFIELAESDAPKYEVFNLCSGKEIKIKEIVHIVLKITNCDKSLFLFGHIPYRNNEVMYFVGDNSKINKYTIWKPTYSLEEGLERTYEWYKKALFLKNEKDIGDRI